MEKRTNSVPRLCLAMLQEQDQAFDAGWQMLSENGRGAPAAGLGEMSGDPVVWVDTGTDIFISAIAASLQVCGRLG